MDKKTYLISTIYACPLDHAKKDCHLRHYRNAPLTDLIKFTNNLSDDDILKLNREHVLCLKERQRFKKMHEMEALCAG